MNFFLFCVYTHGQDSIVAEWFLGRLGEDVWVRHLGEVRHLGVVIHCYVLQSPFSKQISRIQHYHRPQAHFGLDWIYVKILRKLKKQYLILVLSLNIFQMLKMNDMKFSFQPS